MAVGGINAGNGLYPSVSQPNSENKQGKSYGGWIVY